MRIFDEKKGNILKLLSEAISEGIIIVNDKQEIVSSNDAANKMFGYKMDELTGKRLNILIPNEYHKKHKHHFEDFVAHSDKRQMGRGRDLFGIRKNGKKFPVEAGLNPFELYKAKYIMALVSDITVRKEQELQILELNTELEGKITERTDELHKTINQLKEEVDKRKQAVSKTKALLRNEQELNELKTKFLSLVSHEFKTPLSVIMTSSMLVKKYTQTEQQQKREKHLFTIQSKIKFLNTILDDFLSIERLGTDKTTYKTDIFPLSKVVNVAIYDANMLLKEGQKINYPANIEGIEITFDEKILELILANLIRNSIKYSPENTTIDIRIVSTAEELIIDVQDEGIGIPENEQKFIFNRYFRAQNALLDQGTGIGLNIVKSHLENLGGTIKFVSKEHIGTTFTIHIPFNNAESL